MRDFANANEYTQLNDMTRDDALSKVSDIANYHDETTIHIRLDGFDPPVGMSAEDATPADLFQAAYDNGGGDKWWTTEREMNFVGRSVKVGNRDWSSIQFYLNEEPIPQSEFPQPTYLGGRQ